VCDSLSSSSKLRVHPVAMLWDHCPDDEGSTHLWNVGLLQQHYTALHPRRLSSSVVKFLAAASWRCDAICRNGDGLSDVNQRPNISLSFSCLSSRLVPFSGLSYWSAHGSVSPLHLLLWLVNTHHLTQVLSNFTRPWAAFSRRPQGCETVVKPATVQVTKLQL
jgi:hypothetical protein